MTSAAAEGAVADDETAWQWLLELAGHAANPAGDRDTAALVAAATTPFVELYRPLCRPLAGRSRILGHLGQSIDGYIAAASGDSSFVNDQENIRHLHRLRALHDAVIVGAGTIAADDPQLTTRRVPGPSPVRVVLDPRRRLPATARVFNDGAGSTLLVVDEADGCDAPCGQAEILGAPTRNGLLDLEHVVTALAERGLRRLFVEGGGTTVSRFVDAGLLDRLQIAVAPVLTGRGRPGLRLAPNARMDDCPRPPHRIFMMGRDVLFDCDLSEIERSRGVGHTGTAADFAADSAAGSQPRAIRLIR